MSLIGGWYVVGLPAPVGSSRERVLGIPSASPRASSERRFACGTLRRGNVLVSPEFASPEFGNPEVGNPDFAKPGCFP